MAEKFVVELSSDIKELRGSRQLEVLLRIVQPAEPRLTSIDLRLNPTAANNEFELVELCRDDHVSGDSFRFVFRPRYLRKNIKIELLVIGEHNGEPKRIPAAHDQNLINPFEPFDYPGKEDARGIPEREEQFLAFKEFLLQNKRHPVAFLVGPAGSGKSTFLLRFRRWALSKWRNGNPFPFILLSQLDLPKECGLSDFRYHVDRALHLDISSTYSEWNRAQNRMGNDPKKAIKIIREAFRSLNPFSSIQFPEFSAGSDEAQSVTKLWEKAKEFYRARSEEGHYKFQLGLGETIDALRKKKLSPLVLVVVDNVAPWQSEWMNSLFSSWGALKWKAPDTQVVIAVRYPIDVLFPANEYMQVSEALNLSYAEGQLLETDTPEFTLEPLNLAQIRRILEEKLPEFWHDWWETDLITHLLLLTGGNPQAVESILYGWWEYMCEMGKAESQAPSDLAGKEKTLVESILKGLSGSDNEPGNSSEENSLRNLWRKYADDLKAREPHRHVEACEHLRALALDWPAILRVPTMSYSRVEWRRRVSAEKWDDELVELLIALGLVAEQGQNYRMNIPVLCVPIARS